MLREGGNAVDAAVCAVLTSFVCESPLTGFGAGGFMLVHKPGEPDVLVDFFVAAGGATAPSAAPSWSRSPSTSTGRRRPSTSAPPRAGSRATRPGWSTWPSASARCRCRRLVEPGVRLGREGVEITPEHAYFHEILDPILTSTPEAAALYAPEGRPLTEGETLPLPGDGRRAGALRRRGRGAVLHRARSAATVCEWVRERGGTLGVDDMAAYEPIEREPISRPLPGHRRAHEPAAVVGRHPGRLLAGAAGAARGPQRRRADRRRHGGGQRSAHRGLPRGPSRRGFVREFMAADLDEVAERINAGDWAGGRSGAGGPGDELGSTTHLTAIDSDGMCASVTCSNGTGSGLLVPGTGVHVNNMLGEEDLNPHGFHRIPPGRRVSSMMAPTVALRDGEVLLGLGQRRLEPDPLGDPAGRGERARGRGWTPARRCGPGASTSRPTRSRPSPGVDPDGLDRLEARGVPVVRWKRQNLFFGGCQAVARDPGTGELSGGGDPRRGGSVVSPERSSRRGPPQSKWTLPLPEARSAASSACSSASSTAPSAFASSSIRSSSSRSSSSSCLVSAGSSIRAAIS